MCRVRASPVVAHAPAPGTQGQYARVPRKTTTMNYYRFFPGDYLRDTADLTWLEHSAYFRLLMWQYATEQPIADLTHAYRITNVQNNAHRTSIKNVLERFFDHTELGYINPRFKKEQERCLRVSSVRRIAAIAKQMHKQMQSKSTCKSTHTPDSRQKKERYSQDHAVVPPVENEENSPVGKENENLADALLDLQNEIAKFNGHPKKKETIEAQKEILRRRGFLP